MSSARHRGYQLRSVFSEGETTELLEHLFDQSYEIQQVFKDSRSTYAARLKNEEDSLVYKIPRARLRRKWEKLITLIRDSASIRTFKNLQHMHRLVFDAPLPVLAGEKRVKGFVVDRFCCYRFVNGRPAGRDDAALAG